MPTITFNLNGNPVSVDADNDEELLWVLRDRMDVHGLKYGCGMGLCGACTSHIDGGGGDVGGGDVDGGEVVPPTVRSTSCGGVDVSRLA